MPDNKIISFGTNYHSEEDFEPTVQFGKSMNGDEEVLDIILPEKTNRSYLIKDEVQRLIVWLQDNFK